MSEASDDELTDLDGAGDSTGDSTVESAADLAEELTEELTELEALTQERDQFKDIALRLQADFENYRKRAAAQSAEDIDRATGRLAQALLPVLDAAEAAYLRRIPTRSDRCSTRC